MNNSIQKILGLQGLVLFEITKKDKEIFLYTHPRRLTANCPRCGRRSGKGVHEYRPPSLVRHTSLGEKQIILVLFKRRFFCRKCEKPFTEKIEGIKKWARRTHALERENISLLRDLSFSSVAQRLGVTYHAQVKLLKKLFSPFKPHWEKEKAWLGKISLGIDGFSFSGYDMLTTIANLTLNRVVTILPNDKKKTIKKALLNIPEAVKKKIEEVVIDMDKILKKAINEALPDAKIVIDHFHLISDANRRIDEERLLLQQVFKTKIKRKVFFKNKENLKGKEKDYLFQTFLKHPDLKPYWKAKEALREMYQKETQEQAQKILASLINSFNQTDDLGLRQWARSLAYWQEEILNFFDNRTTNAFTEGTHTKSKLLKRISFGFRDKEVFIRKLVLAFLPLGIFPTI